MLLMKSVGNSYVHTHLRELMKLVGKSSWQLITAIHDEEGEALGLRLCEPLS
jgi:hypothetical protein